MSFEPYVDPLIGRVLEGQFRVVSLLGRGGMGSVYIADDLRLGRRYALKVLSRALAEERTNVERFLREARTIARLQHVNIIDVHSLGEDPSGIVFFTMGLLEGEDLESRIKARAERPYGLQEACTWAIQVARALSAVHDAGLIHRDLKAPNVFLARQRDGTEIIKLLDFGIARPEEGSELTRTGVTLGTPSYMSPEQLRGELLDRRSDIYSFGVFFYKLLTGRVPFVGEALQVAMQHWTAAPPVPSHADPEVPAEFDALIVKAMAKARDERQSSMQEIEQALVAWQSAAVPLARPRTGSVATVLDEAMWRDDTQLAVAPPEAARVVQSTAAPVAQVEVVELEAAPVARVEVEVRAPEPTAGLETVVANLLSDTDAVVVRPHAARRPGRGFPALMIGLVGAVAVAVVMMKFGVTATPAPEAAKMERAASTKPLGEETGPEVRRVAEPAEPQVSIVAPEPMKEPEPEPRKADVTPDDPVKAERVGKNKPETEVRAPRPEPNKATRAPAKISPWPEIKRRAQICRAQHDAAGGASIVIEYSVDHKGEVMHAVASEGSALGTCLAKAVEQATFEPKLRLGVEVAL